VHKLTFSTMKKIASLLYLFVLCIYSCDKNAASSGGDNDNDSTGNTTSNLAKGADISWLTQMEASGYKFYSRKGKEEDCMQILKETGMNSIRLRAWVDPVDGWCNTSDVVIKAKRAKSLGMRIMLDLHYSDVWADPGHQIKPASWSSLDFNALENAISAYTTQIMDTLKSNGIVPGWVQVGNETNDGMLWEDGRASTYISNFATLVKAGYDAVKSVSDTTKVIVHISNGFDNNLFRWMFDGLKANGAKWDVIGMSLYPSSGNWQTLDQQCFSNMQDMISRYNTPIMICEVGMNVADSVACKSFLTDIISKTASLPGNNGLGVFYWEPECYGNWQGYPLGAFDNNGKPTMALDAFSE